MESPAHAIRVDGTQEGAQTCAEVHWYSHELGIGSGVSQLDDDCGKLVAEAESVVRFVRTAVAYVTMFTLDAMKVARRTLGSVTTCLRYFHSKWA